MTDASRRSVLAAVGAVLTTAGCVTDSSEGTTGETTTGETTTDQTTTEETTTEEWFVAASNEPEPDHSITLENDADETKTVRVRVVRNETDETVFEATETVESGYELSLYNLKEADPEGVEAFDICAELVESETTSSESQTTTDAETSTTDAETSTTDAETSTTDAEPSTTISSDRWNCMTVQTSECYGDAHVTVREDGSVQVIYAIC